MLCDTFWCALPSEFPRMVFCRKFISLHKTAAAEGHGYNRSLSVLILSSVLTSLA